MQVILLEKIRNLGGVGDQVKVKAGFGRNFLIPQGKAVFATAANVAKFESRRAELEKLAAEALAAAQKRAEKFADFVLVIRAKAAEEGKLFGSIGGRELVKAFADAGHTVQKSEILLPEGAFRKTGDYTVEIQLHGDVSVKVNLQILPEEAAV